MAAGDRTWMKAIQDGTSMDPLQTHGSASVTTGGTVLAVPNGAVGILFQPITQNVRWTLSGTASSSYGFQHAAGGDPIIVALGPNSAPSFAAESGTASLQYQWLQ